MPPYAPPDAPEYGSGLIPPPQTGKGKKKSATIAVDTSSSDPVSGGAFDTDALLKDPAIEALVADVQGADPSFNALIEPFKKPVVTVKVEKLEAKKPPPLERQKAETVRERPLPPMVPRVALPQEWMKTLCDEPDVEVVEPPQPVTPLFTPSDVSIPLLVAVVCTGYAAWRVSRSFTADAPAVPALVPQVST